MSVYARSLTQEFFKEKFSVEAFRRGIVSLFCGTDSNIYDPLYLFGSPLQQKVWEQLQEIPVGETRSYKDLAGNLGDVNKVRAVGNANGANQISILIPCHRVIASNGDLGGYGGGVARKQYLLDLEQEIKQKIENRKNHVTSTRKR